MDSRRTFLKKVLLALFLTPVKVSGRTVPDEEDITDSDDLGTLKLRDRLYSPDSPKEMGYIILRKDTSIESQIHNKENTVFEIRYSFDLTGVSITIGRGCVLLFNGGSLNNGKIILSGENCIKGVGSIEDCPISCIPYAKGICIEGIHFIRKTGEPTKNTHCIEMSRGQSISISTCKFQTGNYSDAIYFSYSSNITIVECSFNSSLDITKEDGYDRGHIVGWYCTDKMNISNNTFDNCGIAVKIQGVGASKGHENKEIIIIGNKIYNCKDYGVIVYRANYPVVNVIISNNIIKHVLGNFINNAVSGQNKRTHGAGIYVNSSDRVVCSGNIIEDVAVNNNNDGTLAPAGIALSDARCCIVQGNLIRDAHKQGILVGGDNNIINGNIVTGTHGTFAFQMRWGKGNIVSNNQFIGNLKEKSNVVHMKFMPGKDTYGDIRTFQDLLFEGNYVYGKQIGIYVEGGERINIKNNSIIDSYGVAIALKDVTHAITGGNRIKSSVTMIGVNQHGIRVTGKTEGSSKDDWIESATDKDRMFVNAGVGTFSFSSTM